MQSELFVEAWAWAAAVIYMAFVVALFVVAGMAEYHWRKEKHRQNKWRGS